MRKLTRSAKMCRLHLIRYRLFERLDAGDYWRAYDLLARAKRLECMLLARAPRLP
jgi:hypothetical protein